MTNCETPEQMVAFITRSVLDELRELYSNALPQEVMTLPDGLSRIKNATGQKFIIIVDEWDVLIL